MTKHLHPQPINKPDDRKKSPQSAPHRQPTHSPTTTTVTNATTPHHPSPPRSPHRPPSYPTCVARSLPPTYSSTRPPHAPRHRIKHLQAPSLRSSAPGPKHQQHIGPPGHLLAMCAATQRAMKSQPGGERGRPNAMRCAQAHAASKPSADLPILGDLRYDLSLSERTSVDPLSLLPCCCRGVGKADTHAGGLAGSLKRSSDMLGCQIPWRRESYDR